MFVSILEEFKTARRICTGFYYWILNQFKMGASVPCSWIVNQKRSHRQSVLRTNAAVRRSVKQTNLPFTYETRNHLSFPRRIYERLWYMTSRERVAGNWQLASRTRTQNLRPTTKGEEDHSTFSFLDLFVVVATAPHSDPFAREPKIATMSNGNGGSYQKDGGPAYQPIDVNGGG